eukprot:INCI16617.1.p1 GENE.INCI16617.1~~INCI16617.1.p1  ORF type:complete len:462 (-),score=63.90 INCI16617.1:105-1490(-)
MSDFQATGSVPLHVLRMSTPTTPTADVGPLSQIGTVEVPVPFGVLYRINAAAAEDAQSPMIHRQSANSLDNSLYPWYHWNEPFEPFEPFEFDLFFESPFCLTPQQRGESLDDSSNCDRHPCYQSDVQGGLISTNDETWRTRTETLEHTAAPSTPTIKKTCAPQAGCEQHTTQRTPSSIISSSSFTSTEDAINNTELVITATARRKKEVEAEKRVENEKTPVAGKAVPYKKYKVPQLRDLLEARGLSRSGRKQELVDRLVQTDRDVATVATTGTTSGVARTKQLPPPRKRKAAKSKVQPPAKVKKPIFAAKDQKFRLCAYLMHFHKWEISVTTELMNSNPEDPSKLRRYVNQYSQPNHRNHHLWQGLRLSAGTLPRAGQHFGLLNKYPHLKLEECSCGALTKTGKRCRCGFCPTPERAKDEEWKSVNAKYLCEGHQACYCPGRKGKVDIVAKVCDCSSERRK